jgi:hypothetical protein
MPLPLIPFVVGAAMGSVVTYLLTNKGSQRNAQADKVLPETPDAEFEEPAAGGGDTSQASSSK